MSIKFPGGVKAQAGNLRAEGFSIEPATGKKPPRVKEFESNYMLSYVLKKIPVYLITNENIGLIGAGFAGARLMKLS